MTWPYRNQTKSPPSAGGDTIGGMLYRVNERSQEYLMPKVGSRADVFPLGGSNTGHDLESVVARAVATAMGQGPGRIYILDDERRVAELGPGQLLRASKQMRKIGSSNVSRAAVLLEASE